MTILCTVHCTVHYTSYQSMEYINKHINRAYHNIEYNYNNTYSLWHSIQYINILKVHCENYPKIAYTYSAFLILHTHMHYTVHWKEIFKKGFEFASHDLYTRRDVYCILRKGGWGDQMLKSCRHTRNILMKNTSKYWPGPHISVNPSMNIGWVYQNRKQSCLCVVGHAYIT